MKIAIIGANGQLGTDLCAQGKLTNHEIIPLLHRDIKVENYDSVRGTLAFYRPDVVINTAAYHRLDMCEHIKQTAYDVNAKGAANLALVCNWLDAELVHISTDYVFDGEKTKPYQIDDPLSPINTYGKSKMLGEIAVLSLHRQSYIVRTSSLFGLSGSRGKNNTNFVETILRNAEDGVPLSVVDDAKMSPTFTKDLAEKIFKLINSHIHGIYHIANFGLGVTWKGFAEKILEFSKIDLEVVPTTNPYKSIRVPNYSVLSNDGWLMGTPGLKMGMIRHWHTALQEYLELRGKYK